MKPNYRRGDKKSSSKDQDYAFDTNYGRGNREGNSVKTGISVKSLKGLPQSTYSFYADPYTSMAVSATPYSILNAFNPIIGGSYKGTPNIDGGNAQQYSTSVMSAFLRYFDFCQVRLGVNYRYLPASNSGVSKVRNVQVGSALIDEMRQATAEATSVLQSTTFTQMPIFNYGIECDDLPMGGAESTTVQIGGTDRKVYKNINDVIYGSSIFYQSFWQSLLMTLNNLNSFYAKNGVMGKSAWNRELPRLRGFFGLMEKSAFKALINSIQLAFPGEFIDVDFATQVNMSCLTPSRRSNSVTDPMLEIVATMNRPNSPFRLHVFGQDGSYLATVFDSETDMVTTIHDEVKSTYFDVLDDLNDLLSAADTMAWARNTDKGTDIARYNAINWRFQSIVEVITKFKTSWNDIREVYETLSRTGLITWQKGFLPSTTKLRDGKMFHNLVVEDIYKLMFSGPTSITFDAATTRWRTYALWNMYTGIPEYAMKSGGSFLTFSFKDISEKDIPEGNEYMVGYIPVGFAGDYSCNLVARDGVVVSVQPVDTVMSQDAVLSRLVPLPGQAGLTIRVPTLDLTPVNGTLTTTHKSTLYKTLNTIFGLGAVPLNAGVPDASLDSDIVAIYQIELEDITNESIAYARAHSPFRGTVRGGDLLGYYGVGSGSKKEASSAEG